MADAAVSKTADRKVVWVRLPPSAHLGDLWLADAGNAGPDALKVARRLHRAGSSSPEAARDGLPLPASASARLRIDEPHPATPAPATCPGSSSSLDGPEEVALAAPTGFVGVLLAPATDRRWRFGFEAEEITKRDAFPDIRIAQILNRPNGELVLVPERRAGEILRLRPQDDRSKGCLPHHRITVTSMMCQVGSLPAPCHPEAAAEGSLLRLNASSMRRCFAEAQHDKRPGWLSHHSTGHITLVGAVCATLTLAAHLVVPPVLSF